MQNIFIQFFLLRRVARPAANNAAPSARGVLRLDGRDPTPPRVGDSASPTTQNTKPGAVSWLLLPTYPPPIQAPVSLPPRAPPFPVHPCAGALLILLHSRAPRFALHLAGRVRRGQIDISVALDRDQRSTAGERRCIFWPPPTGRRTLRMPSPQSSLLLSPGRAGDCKTRRSARGAWGRRASRDSADGTEPHSDRRDGSTPPDHPPRPAAGGRTPREGPRGRVAWTKRAVEAWRQPGNFETEDGKTKRRVRASGAGGRPQAVGPADNRKATEGGSPAQPPVRASSGRVEIAT